MREVSIVMAATEVQTRLQISPSSQYGSVPFTIENLRTIAAEAGEVIPDRVDNTLRQASKSGKKLFQIVGNGDFKPTAQGALYFKQKWNVKPGREMKPKTDDK
jgi:hypothetical protein